ncbi:MATE family efflux transporter [Mycoplasma enhydrae]|uniref:MATE family efflux transporter n=1 Tax=Mycoplasma enhydrae TaxID=2499220 RepID=UPI0021E7A28C|nr:MATE family efflux transporter [Mycoplasma enhydrae]MCV3733796.1 MATE family efflux transporter [Mycoplasma enhydrae]
MEKEISNSTINKTFEWKTEFKYILKLSFPIFIQMFFFAIVGIVGSLATTLYNRVYHFDGSYNGYYFYLFSKIFVVYKIITFLPLIYQLGVLVIGSNLYGQNKQKEMLKLMWSAFYISLILNSIIYLIIFFSASKLLEFAGAKNERLLSWKTIEDLNKFKQNLKLANISDFSNLPLNHYVFKGGIEGSKVFQNTNVYIEVMNENKFATQFLRISCLDVFFVSVAFILNSLLQAVKKNKLAIIGVISASLFRLVWVFCILFVAKNATLASLETILGAIINIVISYILVKKFIFKKMTIRIKQTWNSVYIKEIFKLGVPIALETGIWFVSQYLLSKAIPDANLSDKFIGLWRATNALYDIFTAYLLALAYVTSSVVATEIGSKNINRAKEFGILSFKMGLISQLIFSIIGISLTSPLFSIYSINKELINKYCYFLMAIFMAKSILDVGPLTLLRALWGSGDVWMPNLVSLLTMIGLQISLVYVLILFKSPLLSDGLFIIFLGLISLADPLFRTLLYYFRWNSNVWTKYAKTL